MFYNSNRMKAMTCLPSNGSMFDKHRWLSKDINHRQALSVGWASVYRDEVAFRGGASFTYLSNHLTIS